MKKQEEETIYDVLGIGVGPFNLGLAALCDEFPELKCLFIDRNTNFNWHPGLMIGDARLQVPFIADLVTAVSPHSKFNYMSFLQAKQRMHRFGIDENNYRKRNEYNEYCQWVAEQLKSVKFNCSCNAIHFDEATKLYKVTTSQGIYIARHIVIGIGTVPYLPSFTSNIYNSLLFHSGAYLFKKEELLNEKRITIVGSGQSAAEIFLDLLQVYKGELWWFTRSELEAMDYSKFALEKSTPTYINYFYSLTKPMKQKVLAKQDKLFKGISTATINAIAAAMEDKQAEGRIHIHPNCELKSITSDLTATYWHYEKEKNFTRTTDAMILATGYKAIIPTFIQPIKTKINFDEKNEYDVNLNYSVDNNNSIFVQNADLHTHGFNAADLGMGPHRNGIILNTILGRDYYKPETGSPFQNFDLP